MTVPPEQATVTSFCFLKKFKPHTHYPFVTFTFQSMDGHESNALHLPLLPTELISIDSIGDLGEDKPDDDAN